MKNMLSLLTAALLLSSAFARGDEPAKNIAGSWQGTLDAGSVKLRVVFNITQAAGGVLTATMDSPDQGARGIPVDSVTVTGTSLSIEVKAVNGTYKGALDAAGKAIAGQWTQGPGPLPLNLTKSTGGDTISAAEILSPADLAANKEAAQKVAGIWNGTLAAGGSGLRLRVNITKTTAGSATGTMDSLDQGANGIPISAITLKEGKVRFEARGIGGVYEGTLAADGSALSGQWQQRGQSLPLDLQKARTE
jgi:hypothetical protein